MIEASAIAKKEFDQAIQETQADVDSLIVLLKEIIAKVCKIVEEFSNPDFRGTDKKKFAIEIINNYLDIPYMPEFLEERLISSMIDRLVETANQRGWNLKAKDLAELTEDE